MVKSKKNQVKTKKKNNILIYKGKRQKEAAARIGLAFSRNHLGPYLTRPDPTRLTLTLTTPSLSEFPFALVRVMEGKWPVQVCSFATYTDGFPIRGRGASPSSSYLRP